MAFERDGERSRAGWNSTRDRNETGAAGRPAAGNAARGRTERQGWRNALEESDDARSRDAGCAPRTSETQTRRGIRSRWLRCRADAFGGLAWAGAKYHFRAKCRAGLYEQGVGANLETNCD